MVGDGSRLTRKPGEPGDRKRALIKLYRSGHIDNVDGFDRDYLTENQFVIPYVKHDVLAMPVPAGDCKSSAKYALIHCCCEKGSLLSRPLVRNDSAVRFIDVTKEDDFASGSTLNKVLANLRGPGDMFFYCSPCTGGSAWQHINLAKAVTNRWHHSMLRLLHH